MTTNRKIFAVAIITIVLTGALALFTRRPDGSKVFNRYIACRPPDSFKISEFERHGFREWDALFHDLDSVGFASLALQVLKHHSPTTDFARDYEIYSFSPANAITDNYLVIGKKHSEGYIVVLRYP